MKHLGLFEGIGGFSLAALWAGWQTVAVVEKDKFCQKVLRKNFPHAEQYGDIKQFDGTPYRGTVDVITGGFPCQPYSHAGKRKGNSDDRALWSEMFRVIREVQPAWVVGENVGGLLSMENGYTIESIFLDLESEGYAVQPFVIPACAVEAPHKRDRVWIVAQNPDRQTNGRLQTEGRTEQHGNARAAIQVQSFADDAGGIDRADYEKQNQRQASEFGEGFGTASRHREQFARKWTDVAARFCRMDDGVSGRVDRNRTKRLKALGNAIVPQVAYEIFLKINEINNQ